jgi:hypothetical protein
MGSCGKYCPASKPWTAYRAGCTGFRDIHADMNEMEETELKLKWPMISKALLLLSLGMGFVSIIMNDADKAPIYFLFAVVFWRLK